MLKGSINKFPLELNLATQQLLIHPETVVLANASYLCGLACLVNVGFINALQAASERGHEKIVKLLAEEGADVNAQCGRYGNALQAASEAGHEEVVKLLAEEGADVNAQGRPA